MKVILIMLIAVVVSQANEIRIDNKPTKAVVFKKGAEITCLFKANLKKGINTIVIDSMPEGLDESKISLSEKSGLIISAIQYSLEQNKNVLTPDERKIKLTMDSIDTIHDKIEDFENKVFALNEELSLIRTYKPETKDKDYGVDRLTALATYYGKRIYEIKGDLTDLQSRKREQKTLLSELEKRYNTLTNGYTAKRNMQYRFNINTDNNMATTLKLQYLINNASWTPNYEIRANNVNAPIVFSMKAIVYQASGINWEDIDLELSNRDLNKNSYIPKMIPLFINKPIEIKKEAKQKSVANSYSNSASSSGNENSPLSPSDGNSKMISNALEDYVEPVVKNSNVERLTMNIVYKLKEKSTVLYNIGGQAFNVLDIELPANYEYYAIPKYDPSAFLVAKIPNYAAYNLTQGQAKVYFEGSYIGVTNINPISIEDTLMVSLGKDEEVQVRKEQINEFTETKFLSSKYELSFGNKITIKNNKAGNIKLTIEDQIPVSKFDGAEVNIEELSGAKNDTSTGFLKWNLDLQSNSKKELVIKYKVTAPSNAIIPR